MATIAARTRALVVLLVALVQMMATPNQTRSRHWNMTSGCRDLVVVVVVVNVLWWLLLCGRCRQSAAASIQVSAADGMLLIEVTLVLFRSAWVFLAQELAQLLPAAADAHHNMPPKDPDEYDQLITHFVFAVANANHRELGGTGALAQQLDNLLVYELGRDFVSVATSLIGRKFAYCEELLFMCSDYGQSDGREAFAYAQKDRTRNKDDDGGMRRMVSSPWLISARIGFMMSVVKPMQDDFMAVR